MGDAETAKEREVRPQLPTSGQLLGAVARNLGITAPRLNDPTARRYFSGRLKNRVKDSSRQEIIQAIGGALGDLGLGTIRSSGEDVSLEAPTLAEILDWHALSWDRLRAFLLPRMARIYPSHLAAVWRTYARLATIDLALRLAAHMHLAGASPTSLDFLDWIGSDRRGAYLNTLRSESGLSLNAFTESVGVADSALEAWLYHGVRPSDSNLAKIAKALASVNESSEWTRLHSELRRLYWSSDVASLLGNFIGAEAEVDIVRRLRQFASRLYRVLDDGTTGVTPLDDLVELAVLGTQSRVSEPLLAALVILESDDEWKEDIVAAGSDWVRRVLTVNLEVDLAEVDTLIHETDGQILKNWDIRDPKAYDHYRRSLELQSRGKIHEAIAEVAKAAKLDPLDPANHYSLGSAKGYLGAGMGDEALVKEALDACWMAVTLDPNWISPWTEIGWLLLRTGRAGEAAEHLKGVRPDCGPLDSRYYDALGTALSLLGEFTESLAAYESCLELNSDDPRIAAAAAASALNAGNKFKFNQYRKMARHFGISDKWDRMLELVKAIDAEFPSLDVSKDQDIAVLDAAIARSPDNANAYMDRARAYFLKEEDTKAISALGTAIRLEPVNSDYRLIRGIVYAYMKRYDLVIADMTEVIRHSPGSVTAHYHRGAAYGELDAFDLAIADFSEVIHLGPGHVDAYRGRGDCNRYRGEYDLAIADYDTALQIDPEDFLLYRSRGAAHRMKVEFDLAIADYNAALSLDPEDPLSYRFRGDAYLGMGDYERAIADFDTALEISGADEVAYRSRGNAHLFSGQFDMAIADFNAAIECDPESADAIYGRGLARQIMGDPASAENDYRRAREMGYDDSV